MKEAIILAIKSGYKYDCKPKLHQFSKMGDGMECEFAGANDQWACWNRKDNGSTICVEHEETVLDPLFWVCLGKALGWRNPDSMDRGYPNGEWMQHWQDLLYHLTEGKDVDDFFKSILTQGR